MRIAVSSSRRNNIVGMGGVVCILLSISQKKRTYRLWETSKNCIS